MCAFILRCEIKKGGEERGGRELCQAANHWDEINQLIHSSFDVALSAPRLPQRPGETQFMPLVTVTDNSASFWP